MVIRLGDRALRSPPTAAPASSSLPPLHMRSWLIDPGQAFDHLDMAATGRRRLNATEVAMRLSYASHLMTDAAAALVADEPDLRAAIEAEAARVRELVDKARRHRA